MNKVQPNIMVNAQECPTRAGVSCQLSDKFLRDTLLNPKKLMLSLCCENHLVWKDSSPRLHPFHQIRGNGCRWQLKKLMLKTNDAAQFVASLSKKHCPVAYEKGNPDHLLNCLHQKIGNLVKQLKREIWTLCDSGFGKHQVNRVDRITR